MFRNPHNHRETCCRAFTVLKGGMYYCYTLGKSGGDIDLIPCSC